MRKSKERTVTKVSVTRLEEILATVNPRAVDKLEIELSSSCSSDMPFWADVKVGYKTYRIMLGDIDDRYWNDAIGYFFDIIRESGIRFTCNKYKQQTCSGYKTWTV